MINQAAYPHIQQSVFESAAINSYRVAES